MLLQLTEATAAAATAAGAVGKHAESEAFLSLLWFLVLVLGIALCVLVIYIIRRTEGQPAKVQEAATAIAAPLAAAYTEARRELVEKHTQELRLAEANHQTQLRAYEKLAEEQRADMRRMNEAAASMYREVTDIVTPFTKSNELLAQRIHDFETAFRALMAPRP